MAALVRRRVRTTPPLPGEALVVDWENPITRDMTMALSLADAGYGFVSNTGQTVVPYTAGSQSNTPQGTGGKCSSTPLFTVGSAGTVNSANYSLFAMGSCTSNAVIQSALDMDNSTQRYFQFRIDTGKADFIPFNTSGGGTGRATSSVTMSVAEMSRGFTIGATAGPTRTAVFQNGVVTVGAAVASLVPPGTNIPLYVGSRQTNTQAWATGGLSLVATWARTLTDAEMQSLCDNPWQLFRPRPARRLWLAYSAPSNVSGSILSTLSGVSLAASGSAVNTGSIASTLIGASLAASGTVGNSPSGAIASTLAGVTMAAAGNVTNAGAFSSTLTGASMSASGVVTNRGVFASTLDGATMAASGAVTSNASGAFASTLDGAMLAAGGYVGTPPAAPDFFIRLPKNPRHSLRH